MKPNKLKIKTTLRSGRFEIYHADDWRTVLSGVRIGDTIRRFGQRLKRNSQEAADFEAWKKWHGLK